MALAWVQSVLTQPIPSPSPLSAAGAGMNCASLMDNSHSHFSFRTLDLV